MPEFATTEDVSGLGRRLNDVGTSLAGCQGESRARMASLERAQVKTDENVEKLFDCVAAIKGEVGSLTTKVTIIVGAIVLVGQAVMPLVLDFIKK